MIDWSENYNWTYIGLKEVLYSNFELQKKGVITLDCEHASYDNMKQIVSWVKELGYCAEISNDREWIKVWKEGKKDE